MHQNSQKHALCCGHCRVTCSPAVDGTVRVPAPVSSEPKSTPTSTPLDPCDDARSRISLGIDKPIMADSQGAGEDINLDDLTPEEAGRIIHSRRKIRYGTACW